MRPCVTCVLSAFLIGCGNSSPTALQVAAAESVTITDSEKVAQDVESLLAAPPMPGVPASRLDLDALLAREGAVYFRTHDGVLQGTDNDIDIALKPDGEARIIVYGAGVQVFEGTFHVYIGGQLEIRLEDGDYYFMRLRRDARSLMLAYEERDYKALLEPFRTIPAAVADEYIRRILEPEDQRDPAVLVKNE